MNNIIIKLLGEYMNLNKIIIILVAILAIIACGLIFTMNSNETPAVNATANVSQNVTVEKISTEDASSQQSSGSSGGRHKIMGEDGYYYIVDDNGNILESLGPSKKHYPNGDRGQSSVEYSDAEPAYKYIDKS